MPFHLSTYLVPLLPYVEVWLTQRYGIGLFTTRSFTPDIDDKVPLEILKKRLTKYIYVCYEFEHPRHQILNRYLLKKFVGTYFYKRVLKFMHPWPPLLTHPLDYVQSLTIAIVFELIYYTNGHFQGMTDIHDYIQNAMPTYCINQFFMAYIS